MHLPQTLDEYREDLRRFMRVVVAKQARLVVFPELGGVMVAPPILGDFRSTLLKRADRGRRRNTSLWQRTTGTLAGMLAGALRADFRIGLAALLDVAAADIWQSYLSVFAGLAREYGVVLVAPSAYLPDPLDGVIRNLACVFSPNGELVGRQAKVVLHPEDVDLAQPGATWDIVQTEVGNLGLILGSDVLFPEVGRLLAYQGAEVLITQAACTDVLLYNKIRAGVLARMQDNQLFAVASFLVGENRLSRSQRTPFTGKSAIFAPQELTPRENGVLVEMGNQRSEGVLAAPWDFPALKQLWETSDTPVRKQLPLAQAGQLLAQLYARLQALPRVVEPAMLATEPAAADERNAAKGSSTDAATLEDLTVVSSVTNRWPPLLDQPSDQAADEVQLPIEEIEIDSLHGDFDTVPDLPMPTTAPSETDKATEDLTTEDKASDDETDEMDIVAKSNDFGDVSR
jgi:predicted amidohydrolase